MKLATLQPDLPSDGRPALLEVGAGDFSAWLAERNYPKMHARQVRRWLLQGRCEAFADMTDLPKTLRSELEAAFSVFATRLRQHFQAKDGTHKLLLELPDGRSIESVLIQEAQRRTACISTQVGCAMGCVFCASGLDGVERNLSAGEIVEQLIHLANCARDRPEAKKGLTHIVVMGMGEPLANLDNLLAALDTATDKSGLGLSARRITISTVGLPKQIRKLAECGQAYHLAVSLHAPDDDLRTRIVPTNQKTGIADILQAADYYFRKTGRQLTYEYVLLGGLNDSSHHARELGRLLRGRRAHVNLIPFNNVEGLPYQRPRQQAEAEFLEALRSAGISVKVRKRKGSEIAAACGQLRRQYQAH